MTVALPTVSATAEPTKGVDLSFAFDLWNLLDVPLFTCPPGAGKKEFDRTGTSDWPQYTPGDNVARLVTWKPGHAICGVMGGRVAVVDVDPQNGGDVETTRSLLATLEVTVFAEVATPGTGRHFYVSGHPDLPTAHERGLQGWPGIDILSFGGNAFLPGTARGKYGGRGYQVVHNNLAALADGGDPAGAEALADWVASVRVHQVEDFAPSEPWNGAPPDARQAAYLAKVLASQVEEVAATVKGRNIALYTAGLKLGNYVAGAGLDEVLVIEQLLAAAGRNGVLAEDGERTCVASIKSGLRNGKKRPKAVPEQSAPSAFGTLGQPAVSVSAAPTQPVAGAQGVGDRLVLISFDDVEMAPVDWLWDGRVPLGALTLLAGREGLGKSMCAYQLAADLSRGTLPGEHFGKPARTVICATEDSIKQTIKPRLKAAGADTSLISYVTMKNPIDGAVSLPGDLEEFGRLARGAVLIILDPLMSRLHHTLDSHKDGSVRQALEPLVAKAEAINAAVLGLIHVNKSNSPDLLTSLMGSRAFAAVARAVLAVVVDPDNDGHRVLYQAKNNLGRLDFPGRTFEINDVIVGRVDGKDIHTGQLKWLGDSTRSLEQTMTELTRVDRAPRRIDECKELVRSIINAAGPDGAPAATIAEQVKAAGFGNSTLEKARTELGVQITPRNEFRGNTFWKLPQ